MSACSCQRDDEVKIEEKKSDLGIEDVLVAEPKYILDVTYACGKIERPGQVLTPSKVKEQPKVVLAEVEEKALYTIVMTDPDAPSREKPEWREWVHWAVCNVPASDLKQGDLSNGEVMIEYVGSGPPEKTGLHRYFLIASRQKDSIQVDPNSKLVAAGGKGEGRAKWCFLKFAEANGLEPVAFNCFLAEYDDWVPELYKMLGVA